MSLVLLKYSFRSLYSYAILRHFSLFTLINIRFPHILIISLHLHLCLKILKPHSSATEKRDRSSNPNPLIHPPSPRRSTKSPQADKSPPVGPPISPPQHTGNQVQRQGLVSSPIVPSLHPNPFQDSKTQCTSTAHISGPPIRRTQILPALHRARRISDVEGR
jgi:hypothetical protein